MPALREFLPSDVEAVAALRPLVFRYSHWTNPTDLAAYIHSVFFENPWCDTALPSFVYQSGGKIVGFLGILPRHFRLGETLLLAGVPTQYMVHPEYRGIGGTLLVRAALAGPQDLLLADVPNTQSHRMWVSLGGSSIPEYGISWMRPVRFPGKVGTTVATGLCGTRFRGPRSLAARVLYYEPRSPDYTIEPLTASAISHALRRVTAEPELHPIYTDASFEWLTREAAQKWPNSRIEGGVVRVNGEPIGWFMYVVGTDASAQVLQAVATHECAPQLMRALFAHARRAGAVRLAGRLDPRLAQAIRNTHATIRQTSPGMLVHSRNRDLLDYLVHGNGILTGLEGEWWMRF